MSEDRLEPHLGRMRAKGGRRARRYLSRVVQAAARAGAPSGGRGSRFDGSRIGRGASLGRLLSSRDRHAGLRARRVIVKTRLVRLAAKEGGAARAHLRYIQRDGVTREGDPGELYSAGSDRADGREFLERSSQDRHQFRFIVSTEDGAEYSDLKPLIRRLMTQVEEDLGTRLDWVAVDHFNTAHPHSHIVLRGVDDRGQNLVIAREYIAHGLRERATQLVTLDLGPRTDLEIDARLRFDVGQDRLTATDRRLMRDMDRDRIVSSADHDPFQQSLRAGRLQKLGELGLAVDVGGGRWRLADGLEETLRRMGERGDIIRTMQRELRMRMHPAGAVDHAIFDPDDPAVRPVVGRLVMRGLADEHRDRHYLIVDGVDGHTHYVDIGRASAVEPVAEQAIVRVTPRSSGPRDVDRTVIEVAAASAGRYSIDLHLDHDGRATEAYAESHVRRLEAIRRSTSQLKREPDGTWIIGEDHQALVERYEKRLRDDRPVEVEILSGVPLDRLDRCEGATWLDRELVASSPEPLRDAGFGREVEAALQRRRQWLIEQQLADQQEGAWCAAPGMLATLRRRELLRVAGRLSGELDLPFAEAHAGDHIEGVLTRRIDLISGPVALVVNGREFSLVPWRPVLERKIGREVGGIMREAGISWRIGHGRDGPEVG